MVAPCDGPAPADRSRLLASVIITALAVVQLAVGGLPARADNGPVTRVSLSAAKNFYPPSTTMIVSTSLTLLAGESRHVRGRLQATSSMTQIAALTVLVKCVGSGGAQVGVAGATARNHEGSDTTYYAIPGHLPLYADLLFTAPVAGTYTCGVYAYTASSASSTYHLTAVAGGSTFIEISNTNQVGSRWWQNPPCNSTGTSSTCTYLGAGTAPEWVFYSDGTPVYQWTAASDATAVQALANVTVTTCYVGTGSCDTTGQLPRGTNAVVDFRFEVIQLDPTAHTCRITATTTSRRSIRDDAHHYAVFLALPSIPIDASCGTRRFIMRVFVDHVSGNPIKIDGVQGTTALTHGIAMNLFG